MTLGGVIVKTQLLDRLLIHLPLWNASFSAVFPHLYSPSQPLHAQGHSVLYNGLFQYPLDIKQ